MTRDDQAEQGSAVYGPILSEMVKAQDVRKTSIEQRGIAVVTTSGTLVTLLFGLVSVLTKDSSFHLPRPSRLWLSVSLPLFIASVVLALAVNVPFSYRDFLIAGLKKQLPSEWHGGKDEAEGRVAETRLEILEHNQRINNFKGWILAVAFLFEVLAVSAVALAVYPILSA